MTQAAATGTLADYLPLAMGFIVACFDSNIQTD